MQTVSSAAIAISVASPTNRSCSALAAIFGRPRGIVPDEKAATSCRPVTRAHPSAACVPAGDQTSSICMQCSLAHREKARTVSRVCESRRLMAATSVPGAQLGKSGGLRLAGAFSLPAAGGRAGEPTCRCGWRPARRESPARPHFAQSQPCPQPPLPSPPLDLLRTRNAPPLQPDRQQHAHRPKGRPEVRSCPLCVERLGRRRVPARGRPASGRAGAPATHRPEGGTCRRRPLLATLPLG